VSDGLKGYKLGGQRQHSQVPRGGNCRGKAATLGPCSTKYWQFF